MHKRFVLHRPKLLLVVLYYLLDVRDEEQRKKLEAAYMAIHGNHTAQQIADRVGISRRRLFGWMSVLEKGRLDDLLIRHHSGGRRPTLSPSQQAALRKRLREGRRKRPSEVQEWLTSEFGIRLSISGVRLWMSTVTAIQPRDRPAVRKRITKRVWMQYSVHKYADKLEPILARLEA
jgi:transposase